MIRTYRHPEQKPALSEVEWGRGLPSRYLKGLVTVILRLHSGTTFHLKKAGGPDVFPHSPFRAPAHPSPPRYLLPSNLVLHWFQPGMQFLQPKLETRLHRSQRVFGARRDLAMTHAPKKR